MKRILFSLLALVGFVLPPFATAAIPQGMFLQAAAITTPAGQAIAAQWTNPTAYIDGAALPATDIVQTRIEYGSCVGAGTLLVFGVKAGQFISTGGATHANSPVLAPGTYCIQAFTTAKGIESSPSNAAQVILAPPPQPAPNPPSNLTAAPLVQVADTNAYKLRQAVDGYSMVAIGSVAAGTACDVTHSVDGYSPIPRATVTLASKIDTLPLVTFAHCS